MRRVVGRGTPGNISQRGLGALFLTARGKTAGNGFEGRGNHGGGRKRERRRRSEGDLSG